MLERRSEMQTAPGLLHRVKLYKLNETGGWDDKGTGLVSIGPMEFANHQSNSVGLVVIGEESQKMLMVHRILHEDIYNRQGTLQAPCCWCTLTCTWGPVDDLSVLASVLSKTPTCSVLADETIITWTDPDIGTDVALSFQEGHGCNAIWCVLCRCKLLHWPYTC